MSIGQDIDKTFARIEKAKKRKANVINKNRQIESEIIEIIWKAASKFLEVAGIRSSFNSFVSVAGYEFRIRDYEVFRITKIDGDKNVWFDCPDKGKGKYYSYNSGDDEFRDEIYRVFPEILQKMMAEYAETAEKEADEIEAKNEVGLRVI